MRRHYLQAQEAFQIGLVNGIQESIVPFRHFYISLVLGADLLGLFNACCGNGNGGSSHCGKLKVALVCKEIIVVQVAYLGSLHGLV